MDELFCVRHKEHDYVCIEERKFYKKTFENKHFHTYRNCLIGRNPGFEFKHVQVCITHTLSGAQLTILKDRLSNHLT